LERCGRRPDEAAAKEILALYGIPVPRGRLVSSLDEALAAADAIGFPVCLKGSSADIAHKTEAGAIVLDIKNERELKSAARRIAAAAGSKAILRGLLVEEMLPAPAAEVIIGSSPDDTGFRKVVFGLGGIWVEALGDVSLRLAPLSQSEAEEMIAEIRGRKLLAGFRGRPAADRECVAQILLKFSALLTDLADYIKEIEINPLMVFEKGAAAADALITCSPGNGLSPAPGETPRASES
jgi:acetyltransferase